MKPRKTKVIALALVAALACGLAAGAQDGAALAVRIGGMLAEAYPADGPGATAIVTRGGEVVFRGAAGMADLEMGIALEPRMIFRLGSITKQVTAAAVLLLEQDGKLSVTDPISKTLPDYPTHGHLITIEHLLTHTSGIASYTSIPGYMESRVRLDLTTDELIDEFDDQPMEFAPGSRWNYSNSGYVLLGAIIEKVSGLSYADFVRQRIFTPLGMTDSHYGGPQLIPGRVEGYQWHGDGWVNAPYLSMTQPHAAGSLLSTVDDLARWDRALHGGELLSAASLAKMTAPYVLTGGEATEYGYGLNIATLRGHPVIHHGGGIFGFVTFSLHLPEVDGYVAILSNASGGPGWSPGPLALRIGALLLGDPFPDFERVAVPAETLARYQGVYRIDPDGRRTVVVEDGKLYTQRGGGPRLEAIPAGDGTFFYHGSLTWFDVVEEDGTLVMRMHHDGADQPERAVRVSTEVTARSEIVLAPEVLARYPGAYQLQPGFILTVTFEDGQLMTQATGQAKVPIYPESETRFFLKVVDAQLAFHPGPDGRATAVTLYQGGAVIRGERVD